MPTMTDRAHTSGTDARHLHEITDQGYTIIEGLLDSETLNGIRQALDPWLQARQMGRNNFEGFQSERVYGLLAKNPALAVIVEHPRILGLLDQLLEPDYLLSANLAINSHPGETPQDFHRDNPGGNGSDSALIHGISTIWNIDPFTEDNGATELIPFSHIWQDERPAANDPRAVTALMPAGSVLIFTGTLYHRGGANRSTAPRLAITPQYCQPWLRQLENMVLAVPPEQAARLSTQVQALLGYSVRSPGFMGYVDGVHPRRLIDADYQGRKARGLQS
jgi:ectoine hydroxylase-related dioxygenase (phytanoyl-CoA dioxygenase family)